MQQVENWKFIGEASLHPGEKLIKIIDYEVNEQFKKIKFE